MVSDSRNMLASLLNFNFQLYMTEQPYAQWPLTFVRNIRCANKGNNKITELRAILQRESQNS